VVLLRVFRFFVLLFRLGVVLVLFVFFFGVFVRIVVFIVRTGVFFSGSLLRILVGTDVLVRIVF
jgi:hypothetical protein